MSVYHGNPCRECENRETGCHARCPLYAEWKRAVEERKNTVYGLRHQDRIADGVLSDSFDKRKRRRHV